MEKEGGSRRECDIKELRYAMHIYQIPMMNIFNMYCKYVLIKFKDKLFQF